jgi:hypothetical protein
MVTIVKWGLAVDRTKIRTLILKTTVPGENLVGISVSEADKLAGSPKRGDMIARNPKNYKDQWLVAGQYFADNFDPA